MNEEELRATVGEPTMHDAPAGYTLRVREPDWFEHRMLKREEPAVQIHVFSDGCPEVRRMIAFRDQLRENDADRELYERTKRELAARTWRYVQDYADAKTDVVEGIIARAASEAPAPPEAGTP